MMKSLKELVEENKVLHQELEAAYKYNKELNKWWQFKLERLQLSLSHQHNNGNHLLWKKLARKLFLERNSLLTELNHPITNDFLQGAIIEAAHQRKRWNQDDKNKTNQDWFWTLGYLAGKVLWNPGLADIEKQKHRIIAIAATACNWWNSLCQKYEAEKNSI